MHRQKIELIITLMRSERVSLQLQQRVRYHLEYVLLERKLSADTNSLLAELSPPLRSELALSRCREMVQKLPFCRAETQEEEVSSAAFIKMLVVKLTMVVFSPGDFVAEEGDVANDMMFISRGRLRILVDGAAIAERTSGDYVGEIALLVANIRRTASMLALTFLESFVLDRSDFENVVNRRECGKLAFPTVNSKMRGLATQRLNESRKCIATEEVLSTAVSACKDVEFEDSPVPACHAVLQRIGSDSRSSRANCRSSFASLVSVSSADPDGDYSFGRRSPHPHAEDDSDSFSCGMLRWKTCQAAMKIPARKGVSSPATDETPEGSFALSHASSMAPAPASPEGRIRSDTSEEFGSSRRRTLDAQCSKALLMLQRRGSAEEALTDRDSQILVANEDLRAAVRRCHLLSPH